MANQTLRQLAKDHSLGNLDKDSYRKSRAELLQGIVSGSVDLAEIDYPPPVQPPEPESLDTTERREDFKRKPASESSEASKEAPAAAATEAAPAASAAAEEKTSNKGIVIGLVVAVVLIAIAIVGLMGGKDDKGVESSSTKMTSTAESASTGSDAAASDDSSASTGKAAQLIKDFLEKNNWSEASLNAFSESWSALSDDEVTATSESVPLGQLTNAIYRQLLEEQALSGLVEDDSSINKQKRLVEFANSLGISDSRIKLPEQ